ncbi:MAG: ABC transporter ATP-binding protein [Chloroflexia bacterium]
MLSVEHVTKVYRIGGFGLRKLTAVRDVTFDIGPGEIVSLIGESGSGKSTIGKLILRLTPITSGTIRFEGTDISTLRGQALKAYYRRVQGVFQDPFASYNPIFKADRIFSMVREEFFPGLDSRAWTEKVEGALRAVGLNPPDVLGKFPHQLSGGQLQRFLIARALLLDIRLLIADEIISMLDASTRIDVLNLLADIKSRGLSILFITHDLSLGYYISERAIILYNGTVVEMGPAQKVYESPRHPYTRMLMDSVPRLDRKWERTRTELQRQLAEEDEGCIYYRRCPRGRGECARFAPQLVPVDDDHWVACFSAQR